MATTYTYPHTSFSVKAKQRRVPTAVESSATTLLAPFACDRGPENELVAIDTFSDFIQTYGELDYSIPDQRQILYIGRWLSGGGRVLACRMTDIGADIPTAAIAGNESYFTVNSKDLLTFSALSDTNIYGDKIAANPKYYKFVITAKYSGTYYNGVKFVITPTSDSLFNIAVVKDNITVESFRNKTISTLYTVENNSEYIGKISVYEIDLTEEKYLSKTGKAYYIENGEYVEATIETTNGTTVKYKDRSGAEIEITNVIFEYSVNVDAINSITTECSTNNIFTNVKNEELVFELAGGKDVDFQTFLSGKEVSKNIDGKAAVEIETNLITGLVAILKQPLETPFDCFIDCGYRGEIKKALVGLFCDGYDYSGDTIKRDDAFLYLSTYAIDGNGRVKPTHYEDINTLKNSGHYNMQIAEHYEKVEDIYSKAAGKQVFVTSNYWYARLVPYNDATYGVQWPTAGLTRGVIDNCLYIDTVPSNYQKQSWYDGHYNYIEKDSRGMYFMTQLTGTTDNTALIHTSKVRALLKMKKNLTRIARQYLHEFNDSITKNNLLQALNAEMSNWIQNRTLSYAQIELYDYTENSSLTNEELQVSLNITFTGTVELIPFDITVS